MHFDVTDAIKGLEEVGEKAAEATGEINPFKVDGTAAANSVAAVEAVNAELKSLALETGRRVDPLAA